MNFLNILNNYIDNDYKLFHQNICKTRYKILGIKIPILRKVATHLLREYDYKYYLDNISNDYYEYVMLKGIIIGKCVCSYKEKVNLIHKYLILIDNWAICDIFVGELKFIKTYKKEYLKKINEYLESNDEYILRFGIVCLLTYYIDDEYIEYILNKLIKIKSDYYYVKMAISWTISICLVKYFDKTISFLNSNKNNLDKWTYNKALQKGIESLRISKENKEILRNMKVK